MVGPAQENDFAKRSTEMNGKIPNQMDNKDYGKKRKAQPHKFSVKDTKNGKKYWIPAIKENFSSFLIREADNNTKITDKLTVLPELVVSEIKKLISKGAKDLTQPWKDASELVNTAYFVANIKRPNPDQRGAWKQYTDLLAFGVNALYKAKGAKGDWRSSDVVYSESIAPNIPASLLNEQQSMSSHRFFVKIPGVMDVEIDATDMSEVLRELINKIRRHGATAEVTHRTQDGAILTILRKGQPVEEIVIQDIS